MKQVASWLKDRVTINVGLKVLSLIIAFFIWFLIVQIENPQDSKTFSNIPVTLVNTELLADQNKVYEVLDNSDKVKVTVYAPANTVNQIRNSDIIAEADMSKLTELNTIQITYSVQNFSVTDISGNHETVKLNIEEKSSKFINIAYDTVGDVADGYMIYDVTLDQNRIEVSGPKSLVERVKNARVEIDVTDAKSNLSANIEIHLYDDNGNEVVQPNITTNVGYVHMQVDILQTKMVPIEVEYSGTPAEGYAVNGEIKISPDVAFIAGYPSVLSVINKIVIPDTMLTVEGVVDDMTTTANIRDCLPDNVKLADSSASGRVTVTIGVDPVITKEMEIPTGRIGVSNLPAGYIYEWPEEVKGVTVNVTALEGVINNLTSASVTGTVDIAEYMQANNITELDSGMIEIPIIINVPDKCTCDSEASIQLIINKKDE